MEVSSYYAEGSGTLIDPMLPSEGIGWFRDRPPERIVLTNRHHYRDSDEFRREFGCPVLCHRAGLHEFEGGPAVDGFEFGDELAAGITALEIGAICPEETALHLDAGPGILSFADGLIRYGELGFVSDRLLGDEPDEIKRGLVRSLERLLDLNFDALAFAHGDPLTAGGKRTLEEFVASRS